MALYLRRSQHGRTEIGETCGNFGQETPECEGLITFGPAQTNAVSNALNLSISSRRLSRALKARSDPVLSVAAPF